MSTKCGICKRDDLEAIEAEGAKALATEQGLLTGSDAVTWRAAARAADVHGAGLKNHMLHHVVSREEARAQSAEDERMAGLIAEAKVDLEEQFRLAPPDAKPLVLIAMRGLNGLASARVPPAEMTKALKTVQEMTGMKNEQRMLLAFGQAMFGNKKPRQVESTATPVAELGEAL